MQEACTCPQNTPLCSRYFTNKRAINVNHLLNKFPIFSPGIHWNEGNVGMSFRRLKISTPWWRLPCKAIWTIAREDKSCIFCHDDNSNGPPIRVLNDPAWFWAAKVAALISLIPPLLRQTPKYMHNASLIVRRHLIVDIPYQRYPHLRRVIAPQHITDEMCLYLHLHHLQSTSQHSAEDIGVP